MPDYKIRLEPSTEKRLLEMSKDSDVRATTTSDVLNNAFALYSFLHTSVKNTKYKIAIINPEKNNEIVQIIDELP